MLTKKTAAIFFSLFCISNTAFAELPVTGTLMEAVVSEYGEPTDKTLPIGQPPITRWIYDTFTVVFENDHVVHAFARVNKVENRPLAEIPERPDFVSLIDQARNKPEAKVEGAQLIQRNVSAHQEKVEIEQADKAAETIKSLEMAAPQ